MPWHLENDNPDCSGYAVVNDNTGAVDGCHDTKAEAQDHMAALYANVSDASRAVPIDAAMAKETRVLTLEDVEWRDGEKSGDGSLTVRGHAAVFNRWSLDLGGFREKIAKGAFEAVLDSNPDVHALWDHDTSLVLARTKNKTLDLREDPLGLHFWAKVAPTSYAQDLRILMERGDVDQASFAFTVPKGGDKWNISTDEDGNEKAERVIRQIDGLYDVTVTAQGAYPQTGTEVVRTLRSRAEAEIDDRETLRHVLDALPAKDEREREQIWLPQGTAATTSSNVAVTASTAAPGVLTVAVEPGESVETEQVAPSEAGPAEREKPPTEAELQAEQRKRESLSNQMVAQIAEQRELAREFSLRKHRLKRKRNG